MRFIPLLAASLVLGTLSARVLAPSALAADPAHDAAPASGAGHDAAAAPAAGHAPAGHGDSEAVDSALALKRLVEGNKRFVEGHPKHPHQARDWLGSIEKGQHPFAIVVGCSDSRVPPELVFDQGFGDLFVVRVAGNVADEDGVGSVEYAVDHLGVRLVVVLGHSSCGAVSAALDHLGDKSDEPSEITSLLYRIEPALADIPKDADHDKQVAEAVRKNVQLTVRKLSRVEDLRKQIKGGTVKVVGAVYDMHTGKVELLK
ncbi:MAG: carbonic anhydrase [Verrucomicrobiales bacterium]|nr:carbonic anhydrase [Verrucomicrobiales bacterium]